MHTAVSHRVTAVQRRYNRDLDNNVRCEPTIWAEDFLFLIRSQQASIRSGTYN